MTLPACPPDLDRAKQSLIELMKLLQELRPSSYLIRELNWATNSGWREKVGTIPDQYELAQQEFSQLEAELTVVTSGTVQLSTLSSTTASGVLLDLGGLATDLLNQALRLAPIPPDSITFDQEKKLFESLLACLPTVLDVDWRRLRAQIDREFIDLGKLRANTNGANKVVKVDAPLHPPIAPTKKDYLIWFARQSMGNISSQVALAAYLTEHMGLEVCQGQVSRSLKRVNEHLRAGGKLQIPQSNTAPAQRVEINSLDPALLDMGARQDRRTSSQRNHRDD